jgi:hypothetical protein
MSTEAAPQRRVVERRFYVAAAIGAILVVFAGFARTYYLKGVFGAPAIPELVHVHGIVMTSWFLLFLVQVGLVATRRTNIHRKVGVGGTVLAALMVTVSVATAISAARRGVSPGPPPLVFLVIPLGDLLVFSILVAAGISLRKKLATHKRLMLMASMGILTPAIARIPLEFIATGGPLVFFGLTDLVILAVVGIDTVRNRRLHPAFAWGALLVIASQPLRLLLGGTDVWMRFATWLVG